MSHEFCKQNFFYATWPNLSIQGEGQKFWDFPEVGKGMLRHSFATLEGEQDLNWKME